MKAEEINVRAVAIGLLIFAVLAGVVLWPRLDLDVSGWFYRPEDGFFLRDDFLFVAAHFLAHAGARLLGLAFLLLAALAASQHRLLFGLRARAWLFLFLALLIGPGLVANLVFKDNWGRARPREIVEFGGPMHFTPALVPADQCRRNCSFVNGDGSFGFYLSAFGYVVPPARSRRWFWGGLGVGTFFGVTRIVMGAHFLSDTLFAAFFMLLTIAFLHAMMFGRRKTKSLWANWLFFHEKSAT